MGFGEYCVAGSKERHIEMLQGSLSDQRKTILENRNEWIRYAERTIRKLNAIEKELSSRPEDKKLMETAKKIAAIKKELEEIKWANMPKKRILSPKKATRSKTEH